PSSPEHGVSLPSTVVIPYNGILQRRAGRRKTSVTRPGQDPAPFLAAGRIEALDLVQRTLRVGREELAVSPDVNLEGLALGTVVVVSGVRDAPTGRALVQHIVRPLAVTPPKGEADRASDRPSARALLALVVALLAEIRGAIQTLECEVVP